MVHQAEPIGRRWWDRDSGRVGLGIAVALDDDAGPSRRKLHAAAPMTICSPRARCGSSVPTGRAGFSVGFCGGARAQGGDSPVAVAEESCATDFLSNCYACRKKLHGEDIFMYREKAFCSMECRYEKMVADEYQEKHSSKARKRSPEIASSPCSGGQLFFTGIVVT
ncbi:FCS-Like Zinc finger 13-like [Curcuma longa]|uniref:FCS-Like Zinc finger 13-like n=1 Tax=Curcuma longa TaxID=136217 RepID=UPI003D9DE9C0